MCCNTTQTQHIVLTYLCIYTLNNNNQRKKDHELERDLGSNERGLREKRDGSNDVIIF